MLYSYIVRHDSGFAPNPFWGYCTLACCKPVIRRTAEVGDWIVGLSPRASGNRIIYAMRVDEILPFIQYFQDPRFKLKIPDYSKRVVCGRGDNIYVSLPNGSFRQLRSMHSNGNCQNLDKKRQDLRGKNVLVSNTFWYFGRTALRLPHRFKELIVGRGHKNSFPLNRVSAFHRFLAGQQSGVNAPPSVWPADDESWKRAVGPNTGGLDTTSGVSSARDSRPSPSSIKKAAITPKRAESPSEEWGQ